MSQQVTSINLDGTLYAPESIRRGYLVMMDYYMMLRTSTPSSITNSVTSLSMSLDYDDPLSGSETPVLILMYDLLGDEFGKWRSQIVPFIQQ